MNKLMIKYLLKFKFRLLTIFFLMLIYTGLSLSIPLWMNRYIDNFFLYHHQLILIVIFYFLTSMVAKGIHFLVVYVSEQLGWDIFNPLRHDILDKILSYDDDFFNQNSSGLLLEYLERNIQKMHHFFTKKMIEILINCFLLMGILVVFFMENIIAGVSFLFYVILSLILIYKSTHVDREILDLHKQETSNHLGKYSEWLEMKEDLQLLGKADYIGFKFDDLNENLRDIEIKSQKYLYRVWSLTLFCLVFANALSLFISGQLFLIGSLTLGAVYLLYSYSNRLKEPFENFQVQLQMFLEARTAYQRIESVFGYQSEIKSADQVIMSDLPSIRACQLSYSYQGSKALALQDVSFEIESGAIVGVVGKSGSGKSTFCKLLCKLIEPSAGGLYVDDVLISQYDFDQFREDIIFLSVNAPIFTGTLKQNLTLFNTSISDEAIHNSLEQSGILAYFEKISHDFLNLKIEDEYLSEGQRQIINLARVLFKESKILILDEAASKVDAITKKYLRRILREKEKKSTMILITHDLELLDLCTQVIAFKKGSVIKNEKIKIESDERVGGTDESIR